MKVIRCIIAFSAALIALASYTCCADIQIQDAFCRGGQVFLHWSDPNTSYIGYHVYRSDQAITTDNISQAELVDETVPLNSGTDYTAAYIAVRKGQSNPSAVGLRITDLGTPIDPTDGLKVMTVQSSRLSYYAVVGAKSDNTEDLTITPGGNSQTSGVQESVGLPSPVMDESGEITVYGSGGTPYYYPWETYNWFRQKDEASHDGEPTKVTVTYPNRNTASKNTAFIYLHCISGTNQTVVSWGTVVVSPCDFTSYLPDSNNSWWYGYNSKFPDLSSGPVVNYTENMLLRMANWAKANCRIDPNRLFLEGGSMGATGAISFGFRHPDVFAGIDVQVPQVNPGLPNIGWSQGQLDDIWGSVSTNLPTNEGPGVWDRMNMTAFTAAHKEDLPFLKVQNGKNDTTLLWFQIPDFYKNLNASRHGFISAWGQGGHSNSGSGLPSAYSSFNIFNKIKLNQSYVAVSNSSASNDPGNGDPLDGDSVGQMNAGYDWNIISDTAQGWCADIKYTAGGSTYADISARRLQSFNFSANDKLSYSVFDPTTGSVFASGDITAERDKFFVIPHLYFDGSWRRLTIWKSSSQAITDIASLSENDPVDIDNVIIAAVFPDICYSESIDRVPTLAILGATGLSEGNIIHLTGTKTMFGKIAAVNASPSAPMAHGTAILKPLGTPRPFEPKDNPATLGSLVKVWGKVQDRGTDWFTLKFASGKNSKATLIYGSVGTPPAVDTFVTVIGISSETTGPNGETCGIRVRRSTDIVGS